MEVLLGTAMAVVRSGFDCEELYIKRIYLEKLLGVKPTTLEKCLRICRAYSDRDKVSAESRNR